MTNLRREAGAFFFFTLVSFTVNLAMSHFFRALASMTRTLAQAMIPCTFPPPSVRRGPVRVLTVALSPFPQLVSSSWLWSSTLGSLCPSSRCWVGSVRLLLSPPLLSLVVDHPPSPPPSLSLAPMDQPNPIRFRVAHGQRVPQPKLPLRANRPVRCSPSPPRRSCADSFDPFSAVLDRRTPAPTRSTPSAASAARSPARTLSAETATSTTPTATTTRTSGGQLNPSPVFSFLLC